MDYNISEEVNTLATQIAGLLTRALAERQTAVQPTRLDVVETQLRELLRAIGGQALGTYLSTPAEVPSQHLPCACGGKLAYQREREAVIISVFGRVGYRRAYYAGCTCGQGQAPRDVQLGIEPGAVSPGLANLLALGGIELAFEQSVAWLEAFLGFRVAGNTIRQETEQLGACQAEQDAEVCRQGQDEDCLQAQLRQALVVPERLYGSIDAAKVRMEPRTQAREGEKWRDLKLGCWYTAEVVRPMQRSARQRDKAARDQPVYRATHQRYYCAIDEADRFGQLLWGTGCQVGAERVPELVFVCDGAAWIWNLIEHYDSQAVQIVDWYHAEDYLKRVAEAAWSEPTQRASWLQTVTSQLWDGQVAAVIEGCQTRATHCAQARTAVIYFTTHAPRMRYDQFRAQGYLIGSGTVESGCKQVVTERLKKAGAQWTRPGAVYTAKARADWLSGQWDALCARRYGRLPLAA
jgi:hypothetical protein